MPEQDPAERIKNFNEVPLGFSSETAIIKHRGVFSVKSRYVLRAVL